MTITDLVADMLTRIRNAVRNKENKVEILHSNLNVAIADALKREGFIGDYAVIDSKPAKTIQVYLKYGPEGQLVINRIDRASKPGRRLYKSVDELGTVQNGMGIYVVSTPKGVLSDRECRKQRVGGEVLCKVW